MEGSGSGAISTNGLRYLGKSEKLAVNLLSGQPVKRVFMYFMWLWRDSTQLNNCKYYCTIRDSLAEMSVFRSYFMLN
jgi:hypothetical protein